MKNTINKNLALAAFAACVPFCFSTPVYAQQAAAAPAEKETVRIKMITKKDGVTTVTDTTVEILSNRDDVRKILQKNHPELFKDIPLLPDMPALPEGKAMRTFHFDKLERMPQRPGCDKRIIISDSARSERIMKFRSPGGSEEIRAFRVKEGMPGKEGDTFRINEEMKIHLEEMRTKFGSPEEMEKLMKERGLEPGKVMFRCETTGGREPVTLIDRDNKVIERTIAATLRELDEIPAIERSIIIVRTKIAEPKELEELKEKNENIPTLKRDLPVDNLNMYPNPSSGRFTLAFTLEDKGNTHVRVYDELGREVYREQLKGFSGPYSKEIDLSGSPKGVYFVQVTQGKSGFTRKVVLE